MLKKIKNIFYLASFFIFIFLITSFYFSDQNVKNTNKSRTYYLINQNNYLLNLPLLKNDTGNIIEYKNDIEVYKKNIKKYTFWCLIKKCTEKQ